MTRHKKMQMLLSILVCDTMEKDAEKTVNRGVFDKNRLSCVIFTQNVLWFKINTLPLSCVLPPPCKA